MTPQEVEAKRLRLQQWGLIVGLASVLVATMTLYLNTHIFFKSNGNGNGNDNQNNKAK